MEPANNVVESRGVAATNIKAANVIGTLILCKDLFIKVSSDLNFSGTNEHASIISGRR